LDDPYPIVSDDVDNLIELTWKIRRSIGDGILIQQAMGYQNYFLASVIIEHSRASPGWFFCLKGIADCGRIATRSGPTAPHLSRGFARTGRTMQILCGIWWQ
jgi:hypothetical protein